MGERWAGLAVLIDYWKKVPKITRREAEEKAIRFLHEKCAAEYRPRDDEIRDLVRHIYQGGASFGCSTPVMARRCCRSDDCAYWKGK